MAEIGPDVRRWLAPNPGPMTLEGTNTWILGRPGQPSVVVDPGPAAEGHLRAVRDDAGEVVVTVLTHRHPDHSDGLPRFAELTGAGVRAADPAYVIATSKDDGRLDDGDLIEGTDLTIRVLATPGHTSDSISLLVTGDEGAWLVTGDMVLGRGTTVITHPDGDLGAYLDSLELMLRVVTEHEVRAILPGHGPVVNDPGRLLRCYRKHRLERLEQVREALRLGDETAGQIVARVYAEVDRSLWPAAEQSVRAQLEYLQNR
ncbi:MAG: MBL fold metallo-hydrolase [Microlunatus sp.]